MGVFQRLYGAGMKYIYTALENQKIRVKWKQWEQNGYKRIYHFHIRKTGGTSVNRMFYELSGIDPDEISSIMDNSVTRRTVAPNGLVFVNWNRLAFRSGLFFYAHSHLPMKSVALPSATFTFTILRDPLNRVLSHYRMLRYWMEEEIVHPAAKKETAWARDGFRNFIERVPRNHLLNQLYVFSPKMDLNEAEENLSSLSMILRTEKMDHGIAQLNNKLNTNLCPVHVRKTPFKDQIDESDKLNLREMLDPEYELIERLERKGLIIKIGRKPFH